MKVASVMNRDPQLLSLAVSMLAGGRHGLRFCYEDDEVASIEQEMVERFARRLPVVDREQQVVGVVTLDAIRVH